MIGASMSSSLLGVLLALANHPALRDLDEADGGPRDRERHGDATQVPTSSSAPAEDEKAGSRGETDGKSRKVTALALGR